MASDNFNRANEDPLSDGGNWGAWGTFGQLALVSNAVKNNSGSAADRASCRVGSAVGDSQCTVTTVGGRDGGPAIHCDTSTNGYILTNFDGVNIQMYRVDAGAFTQIGTVVGAYVAADTLRLRRSAGNVITSRNGTDILTVADSTYTGGLDSLFVFDTTLVLDDWTNGVAAGGGASGQLGRSIYVMP